MSVRSLVALAIVVVAGCGGASTADVPSGPSSIASISGTWTGRASGVETADFSLSLSQTGATITGMGTVSFPGDLNRFALSVTGSIDGSSVSLRVQPSARPAITYEGTLSGTTLIGRLNGGDIQHDGPFVGTPLTLQRQ